MTEEVQPAPLSADQMVVAAQSGDWDAVEACIGQVADQEEYMKQAVANLESPDVNLQDLSFRLIEARTAEPTDRVKGILNMALWHGEPHMKVRSAFVLFKHGERRNEVIDMLRSARDGEDEGLAAKAQDYLDLLEQERREQ